MAVLHFFLVNSSLYILFSMVRTEYKIVVHKLFIWKIHLAQLYKTPFKVIYQNHSQINTPYVINIIVNPIYIFHCTLSVNPTMLVNNYVKLVITFINVTCTIELKIYVSCNNTPLNYGVKVIFPRLASERGPESHLER